MKRYIEIGLGSNDENQIDWTPVCVEMEKVISADHMFLLDFISYDFSDAEKMLGKYLSCCDDDTEPDRGLLKKAIAEIQSSHPYFSSVPSNAAWLLNRIIAGYILQRKDLKVQEMRRMFSQVCVDDYSPYTVINQMFNEYINPEGGYILGYIMSLQKRLKRWLFMVIDDTNPDLAKYSIERRSMLYGYFYGGNNILTIKTEIRPTMSDRMRNASIQYDFDDLDPEEETGEKTKKGKKGQKSKPDKSAAELLSEAYSELDLLMDFTPGAGLPKSVKLMLDGVGLTKKEQEAMKSQGRDTGSKEPEKSGEIVYIMDDFPDLLDFEVYGMINAGSKIRRCKNCGRFFVPVREKDEFCNRPISGTDETCYDRGLRHVFKDKTELKKFLDDEYNKASKRHDSAVSRGTETREFMLAWRKEALRRKKLVLEGAIDPYEYKAWLGNK